MSDLPAINRQVCVSARPQGIPQAEHFCVQEVPIPALAEGQILVRNQFLSVDPAMRGWLSDRSNYAKPIEVGDVMRSLAAGHVVASRNERYPVGTPVTGWFGWQEHAVVTASDVVRVIKEADLPLSLSLGVLGLTGLAAHVGLTLIGQPREGETVVVSTAAGAVGSVVGQIARILGCRTIGITGSAAKAELCAGVFGYDAVIDYTREDVKEALAKHAPDGVDVYFDNTAGSIGDAVLQHLAVGARVVVCGTASVPSWDPPPLGPRVERILLTRRARMQGFVTFDHADRYEASIAALADWVRSGRLNWREDILYGLEACPDAIAGLYRGENLGKRLVQLSSLG